MEINGRIVIFPSEVYLLYVYEEVSFRFGKD